MTVIQILLYIIAGIILIRTILPGIAGPFLIHARQRQPAHPSFKPFDPRSLPEDTADFFIESVTLLGEMGFTFAGYFSWEAQEKQQLYFALMSKPADNTLVMAVFATSGQEKNPVEIYYIEYASEFRSGVEILTNNNPQLDVCYYPPDRRVFAFPHIADPRHLYILHRRLVERHAGGMRPFFPGEGREVNAVYESIRQVYENQVRVGYFYLDEMESAYRPTWKGAFLMTWKLLWPVVTVWRILLRRRANALIAELLREEEKKNL